MEVRSTNALVVYANATRINNGRRTTKCIVPGKIDVRNRTFLGLLAVQFCELVYFMWAVNRGWKFYRIRTYWRLEKKLYIYLWQFPVW